MKPSTPSQAIDEHTEDEKIEQKTEGKNKNKEQVLNPIVLVYLVAFYDPHGSYSRFILKPSHPQGIYIYIQEGRPKGSV